MWSEYVYADQRSAELRAAADDYRRARLARSHARAVTRHRRRPRGTEVVCLRAAATGRSA